MSLPLTRPLPARRSELVLRSLGEGGTYVAKEPRSGAYYQLGAEEHFLLGQLDGTRSAEAIRAAFAERFGQPLSAEEMALFVEMARSRGFLEETSRPPAPWETGEPTDSPSPDLRATLSPSEGERDGVRGLASIPKPAQTQPGGSGALTQEPGPRPGTGNNPNPGSRGVPPTNRRQSILYRRKSLFDPDRLFTWLAPRLWMLWTRPFLVFSASCIVLAALVLGANHREMAGSVARALSWETAVLTWLVLMVVTTLHESAHGLTCKRYGGEVHEIGFLLIYFQPAFYCNVSDAWLFPEKAKRLWVTLAGAYFELFLWALATLVWRVTETDVWPNHLALLVMAASGLACLFNLNPLIKLDGYYMLSDYLEIPNLRQRAFQYLGDCARRLVGSAARRRPEPSPREKRVFLVYGLLAWAYSASLLGVTFVYLGRVLTDRYQAWGLALFAALVGLMFQSPLARVYRRVAAGFALSQPLRRWTRRLVWLAVLGALVTAMFLVRMELKIAGPFTILPIQNADVRPEVEGIIEAIFVDEGDRLNRGDPIARLSDRDYRTELQKTRAELDEKRARLRLLRAGTRPEEIEVAKTLIAKADERLKYAKSRLEMDTKLYDSQLLSLRELQESQETVSVCTKDLQEAQGKLTLLLAGNRAEELEEAAAAIGRLHAQEQLLEDELKRLLVVSPISGVVTTHRLRDKVGQSVRRGDLIATVHELGTVTAEVSISEKEIADVKVGQPVVLKARAYPEQNFAGTVAAIAPIANREGDPQSRRVFLVTTQIRTPSPLLASEMTGNAKIYCGKRRVVDLLTRRLVRYLRVEVWSWW